MPFDPKDPEEAIPVSCDFQDILTPLADTIAEKRVEISVKSPEGGDPDVADMLDGAPQISGTAVVLQKIIGGVEGVKYNVRFEIDTVDGYTFVEAETLQVKAAS